MDHPSTGLTLFIQGSSIQWVYIVYVWITHTLCSCCVHKDRIYTSAYIVYAWGIRLPSLHCVYVKHPSTGLALFIHGSSIHWAYIVYAWNIHMLGLHSVYLVHPYTGLTSWKYVASIFRTNIVYAWNIHMVGLQCVYMVHPYTGLTLWMDVASIFRTNIVYA